MFLIFQKMLMIALLLAMGVLIYRRGILSRQGSREISALVVQVCSPVMIICGSLQDDTAFTLGQLLSAAGICLGVYGMLLAVGELLPRLLGVPAKERPYYSMLSLFGNVGFIGLPVGISILGSGGMLYILIFNIVFNLFFYSYGLHTMSRAVGGKIPFTPRSLANPGMVSCLLSVGIYVARAVTPFAVPVFWVETLEYVSNTTTFLAMVVMGVNLAVTPMEKIWRNGRMYVFLLARYLLLPWGVALFLGRLLPGEGMLVSAYALMAAMPAGNMSVMLASQYGAETDTLTAGIILSTLASVALIPLVSMAFP